MWLYGHRGAPATLPENTMPSFEEALRVGVDAIETDIRVSSDLKVVVFHDADASRLVGHSGTIESSPWSEIADWDLGYAYQDVSGDRPFVGKGIGAPLLEEVLSSFPTTRLNIDIKDGTDRAIQATVEVIRSAQAEERVLLTSFHTRADSDFWTLAIVVPWFRYWTGPSLAFGSVTSLENRPTGGRPNPDPVEQAGIRFGKRTFIKKMHALGIAVDFWTINEVQRARADRARCRWDYYR